MDTTAATQSSGATAGGGSSKIHARPGGRKVRRGARPVQEQRFTSYLVFGMHSSLCLGLFLAFYALLLLCLSPLLYQKVNVSSHPHMHRGQALRPVVDPLMQKVKKIQHAVPGGNLAEGVASALKKQLAAWRKEEGVTDAMLMKKAAEEMRKIRKKRREQEEGGGRGVEAEDEDEEEGGAELGGAATDKPGFMVLGMHRSGTSMLSGLLVTGYGYNTGGPLIGQAFDNEKGFFERIDVVLQNDEFMRPQRIWWSSNVMNYDPNKALEQKKAGKLKFEYGTTALAFLNNAKNTPWLQKDPRMCITLKTWLSLLDHEPAIIFTYRHPLEVANSLKKRESNFNLEHGLRLWIVYNMRAIQNSASLCRVTSSNDAVLENPLQEVQRIVDDLTNKCRVPAPPQKLTQEDVDKFIDPNLQHNKKQRQMEEEAAAAGGGGDSSNVIATHKGKKPGQPDCVVKDYKSDYQEGTDSYERERGLYLKSMKLFCDLESGAAYAPDFNDWPELG